MQLSRRTADVELFTRWQAGDRRAGGTLVKRYSRTLRRFFAKRARGYEEDLSQATLVACVEGRDTFRGEASFRVYLFTVARFQLVTHYRKVQRRSGYETALGSAHDAEVAPSGALVRQQVRALLESALHQIPNEQRVVLELMYWNELEVSEVATLLRISQNTVYSRLRRGKGHLRAALEPLLTERGGDHRFPGFSACED